MMEIVWCNVPAVKPKVHRAQWTLSPIYIYTIHGTYGYTNAVLLAGDAISVNSARLL